MSASKLNIRQRKALHPFVCYTWKAEYSAATHKFYLDDDSTMRWKQDANNECADRLAAILEGK